MFTVMYGCRNALLFRGRADTESHPPSNSSVLNEELQNKISDNERLNKELSQVKVESSTTIMQVQICNNG